MLRRQIVSGQNGAGLLCVDGGLLIDSPSRAMPLYRATADCLNSNLFRVHGPK